MTILKNNYFWMFLVFLALTGCSVSKKVQKDLVKQSEANHHFTGVLVYNTKTGKNIIDLNASKYFTPASNTKLFTFYTAWKTLRDSVAGFEYDKAGDSLILRGTADPGFLNDSTGADPLTFLRNLKKNIYLIDENIEEPPYGDGWSWGDYPYAYMPEKSIFPIYGNTIHIDKSGDSLLVTPAFFYDKVHIRDTIYKAREKDENIFYLQKKTSYKDKKIPFKTSSQMVADLLGQELGAKVTLIPNKESYAFKPFYRTAYDSLFTKMLVESDNFIAEQLMLQVGQALGGKFSVSEAITYSLEHYLPQIPQVPRWVDGSGLSRYNLFTPASMVHLLKKMHHEVPKERLFDYFPKGGRTGTLKNNYKNQPYIRAKSGTLSNNYNLSGYLITKKGTVLIFSYMSNHYQGGSSSVKEEISGYLARLYKAY